ncbi:MAG: putative esterase [Bryobacterales bacterium]|nr:putative esterase [Bryobacterales bacterium]
MAWFRPDLYHRVLSYSGTFVNLRSSPEAPLGAYEYIEHLFPDTPQKPLRLSDGVRMDLATGSLCN